MIQNFLEPAAQSPFRPTEENPAESWLLLLSEEYPMAIQEGVNGDPLLHAGIAIKTWIASSPFGVESVKIHIG